MQKFGTDRLVLTTPFPIYGLFRYLYLVHQREGGGSPSEVLLTDRPLLACVALWGLAVDRHHLSAVRIDDRGPMARRPKSRSSRTSPATVLRDYHTLMNLAGYQDVLAQGRRYRAQGQHLVALLLSRAPRPRRGSSTA